MNYWHGLLNFFSNIFNNQYKKYKQYHGGAPEIILSCLLLSIVVVLVRDLSYKFHISFIIAVRNIVGLLILMPQIIKHRRTISKSQNIYLNILRSANGTVSMFIWFLTITYLPLSEAVSLSFLTPIFTVLASIFFFKEKISKNIFYACLLSFVGVLIILRPGFNNLNIGYLFSLLSIIFWTISNLIVKTMTKTDKTRNIVAQMTFFMLIFSLPFALPHIQKIDNISLIKFIFLGIFSNISYRLIAQAYKKSSLAVLQPLDFSRLIFTSLIAYFIFNEKLDLWVFIGSLIILLGLILTLKKESKTRQKLLAQNLANK